MRTVIEKSKKHSLAIIVAIAFLSGIIATISLYAEEAEAVAWKSVGIIGGELNARANDGWEYITISYSGAGEMDIDGWSLHAGEEEILILSGVTVPNGGVFRVCEDVEVQGDICDAQWVGGERFNDTAGSYYLKNANGEVVFAILYSDVIESTRMPVKGQLDGAYVVPVLRQNDKVTFCHNDVRKGMQEKKITAGTFINKYLSGKNGHHADEGDIIPPFFYDQKNLVGYYAGKNWEGNEAFMEAGCM